MTQSASPSQITLSAMRDLFVQKFPDRVKPFDQVKPDLEGGTGAQALANLIGCEVEVRDDQGCNTYCWTGRSGPFEMKVPKPFDPVPQRVSEPQQQAQVQSEESEVLHEEPWRTLKSSATSEQARADPPAPPEEGHKATDEEKAAELEPIPPAVTAQGLFAALAALLGDSTLLADDGRQDGRRR